MIRKTPNWAYWWAVADTLVELPHCIALSLNINPHEVPRGSNFIGRFGLPWFVEDANTVNLFHTRLRILHAHRLNGNCFSPVGAHPVKQSVLLREFAEWALRKFAEPAIPYELAVLGVFGKAPLPESEALAKIVATWRSAPTRIPPIEMVSIVAAYTNSSDEKTSPSIVGASIQRRRISIKAQNAIIFEAIASLKFEPMRFPKSNYVNGAKKLVLNACIGRGLTRSQFHHRWQDLRKDRKIIDNGD